ncbi:MAG: DUF1844 domain-containing protein [Algisphaera sp.]
MAEDPSPIIVDSDWKAQAQAEKETLAEKAKDAPAQESGDLGQMPPATFEVLVSGFVSQALFALGAIPDPQTGKPMLSLELAKHHIDMLGVLEAKTQGNLTDEESKLLAGTMYELRERYVQVANAARGAGA